MDFRNCFGMMASVSTFSRSIGATRPVWRVKACMAGPVLFLRVARRRASSDEAAGVDEMAVQRRGRGHRRADEVRAPARALPALEVAVAGRCAALARLEAVRVHRQAHRATGLA